MKRFIEYTPSTSSVYLDITGSYSSATASKGELILIKQDTTIGAPYIGTGIAIARPGEQSIANAMSIVAALRWNADIDYVFTADGSAAAATRRFFMYTFNRKTWEFNWVGSILANFVTNTGVKTIRAFRGILDRYTTGTVSASGTSVTGNGTLFQTSRMAAGGRIGFGSTDPNQITTWYEISSIASDTSLTLTTSAGTIASNTPYVIEEIRLVFALTNATATNGGLFLIKGLNPATFSPLNTNIAEAATADNIRGIYWLSDHTGTVSMTNSSGMGLEDTSTATTSSRMCYVFNGTTTAQMFKYNIRASLSGLSAGKSNSAFLLATGVSPTLTGTAGQANNGRLAKLSHGPGSGSNNFYFTTGTRVYRLTESNIITGSTTFLSDNMVETPPGSINTYTATSALASIDYAESVDRFIIPTTLKTYITRYKTDSSAFDLQLGSITGQIDPVAVDSNSTIHITNTSSTAFSIWTEGGILYLMRNTATVTQNQLYAIALAPHWTFDNQYFISPEITLPSVQKLSRIAVHHNNLIGNTTLGLSPEPFRIYVRTSGITDNTGEWTLVNDNGDISGLSTAGSIQVKISFKTLGPTCIPSRVYAISILYEDNSTDSHYIPSVDLSSSTGRTFTWRQTSLWNMTIPNMKIQLSDVSDDSIYLVDSTASSTSGVWEYSTDGETWHDWSSSADAVGNFIRYTADSLPDGVNIKATVFQA